MAAGVTAVAQQVDIAADALGAVAVVAHTIYMAWRGNVEALRIDGRCRAACTCDSGLYGGRHLIEAYYENHLFRSP